jgi:hypothetical protein
MSYEPAPAFKNLFTAFTGGQPQSIGTRLTDLMREQRGGDPLIVSTASDIVCFPGGDAPPCIESFRRSTRGFIELTAVSHLPLAVCYVARMRELAPASEAWREQLQTLIMRSAEARQANTIAMWRDQVALQAFAGAEANVAAMVDYTLATCIATMQRALADPGLLRWDTLREQFLDAPPSQMPVNMNDIMFATFGLAYVDIAFRIGEWLRGLDIVWPRAMVLVSGQSGRPTAGVTWSSNNICNLIWKASDEQLPPERLYVAPHAPPFSAENAADVVGLRGLEKTWRQLWCHTRASVEVARLMFEGHDAFAFRPTLAEAMPPITTAADRKACVARLRRIMEDPQQLISNCVADYIVDELARCGQRPERVCIPGFTGIDYTQLERPSRVT